MTENKIAPENCENTWLWLVKVGAGLFIVILLAVHFIVNHLVAPGGLLSYQDVLRYYQNPVIPIMEAFFLVFVVGHALLGLRGIILDLDPPLKLMRGLDILLILVGITAVSYGIWLIFAVVAKGTGLS